MSIGSFHSQTVVNRGTSPIITLAPSQVITQKFVDTFTEFPPRRSLPNFIVDDALKAMKTAGAIGN